MGLPDPPPCSLCGGPMTQLWVDTRTLGEAEPRLIPGKRECADPGCARRYYWRIMARDAGVASWEFAPWAVYLTSDDKAWIRRQFDLARER